MKVGAALCFSMLLCSIGKKLATKATAPYHSAQEVHVYFIGWLNKEM